MTRKRTTPWYYDRQDKKPPPENGIRVTQIGNTWWGKRWIEALQSVLEGDDSRLARGRTYARAGRTHDLVVKGGTVTAKVTGSRATPYKISIKLVQLPEHVWNQAISLMAQKAQFSAELLSGKMPQNIDEVFLEAGASLFPTKPEDLKTSCSCPDWGDPCKHVAATHYVLGEALDRDPFLLFELRGRTQEQILEALRKARAAESESIEKTDQGNPLAPAKDEIPKVTLGKIKPEEYDRVQGALPALHFTFESPAVHGALIRQLGEPPAWSEKPSPTELLAPIVQAASLRAQSIALAELEAQLQEATPSETKPAAKGRS